MLKVGAHAPTATTTAVATWAEASTDFAGVCPTTHADIRAPLVGLSVAEQPAAIVPSVLGTTTPVRAGRGAMAVSLLWIVTGAIAGLAGLGEV